MINNATVMNKIKCLPLQFNGKSRNTGEANLKLFKLEKQN